MSKEKRNSKKIIQVIGLFLFLVVLPGGSWLFLQRGENYQLDLRGELKELGRIESYAAVDQSQQERTEADLHGQVTVASFLKNEDAASEAVVKRLLQLHEQFDDRKDVFFLSHMAIDTSGSLYESGNEYGIKDTAQWRIVRSDVSKSVFQLPEEGGSDFSHHVALIDTSGMVRKVYDTRLNPDMGRLIEHIAILMPIRKKKRGRS
jgi:hypothetical protein